MNSQENGKKGQKKENKYKNLYNICQIILQYELIYVVKFIVFVFVVCEIYVNPILINSKPSIDKSSLIGILTFIVTVVLDCFVLTKSIKENLKGILNVIHLLYAVVMLLEASFVLVVFRGTLPFSYFTVVLCDLFAVFGCLSPFVELGYDVLHHCVHEELKEY